MQKPVVLLAAGDVVQSQQVHGLLQHQGYEVVAVSDTPGVLRAVHDRPPDLVIIGPAQHGAQAAVELAQQIRHRNGCLPIILLAPYSTEELAIAALRAGVTDYFKPPWAGADLLASVRRSLTNGLPREPRIMPAATPADLIDGPRLIGESASMQQIKAYIRQVAATESNVLITGETGTGKELVAELIHKNSQRRQQPLVCINCAAIPDSLVESELFGHERGAFTGAHATQDGLLKQTNGGTVFFDEIGDMSLYAQAKILRALESREMRRLGGKGSLPLDIRVMAATNRNLEQLMAAEKFRTDLYFRLNVASVHLPPLRDRREDLLALCAHYMRDMNQRFERQVEGFTDEAMQQLLRYDWPGNVRELKNLVEATFINMPAANITLMDLPEPFCRRLRQGVGRPPEERDRVLFALWTTNWNKSQAAQQLHWSRMTLYRKMTKYQLVH